MKLVFVISALVYGILCWLGLSDSSYVDISSRDHFYSRNMALLIVSAIFIGFAYFFWFRKVFPVGYEKQPAIAKILLPVFLQYWLLRLTGVYYYLSARLASFIEKEPE